METKDTNRKLAEFMGYELLAKYQAMIYLRAS